MKNASPGLCDGTGDCKTMTKMAVARIKLLKNKREAVVKQMRHDIAVLLRSGQDATARIRGLKSCGPVRFLLCLGCYLKACAGLLRKPTCCSLGGGGLGLLLFILFFIGETRNATGLVAPAIAAGLGALTHALGTLVPVIGASGFATAAAVTTIGIVVGSFR